ncbi:tetratricopeptide repeat protein [Motiliproteus coralliicola]|uniref:tetratricopeptide repeat protein n=1 Tax=Motiliproteus coralliicola TaxID=2283196 RepID=UPI00140255B6|nr:tetratricopeptide repeat protein [Motiliproteus coralliicola]
MKPPWKHSTSLVAGGIVAGLLWGCAPAAQIPPQPILAETGTQGATAAIPAVDGRLQKTFDEALSRMKAKQFHEAAKRLEAIAREGQAVPGVQLNLGIAYLQLGEHSRAEQALRQALALDGGKSITYNQLGILLRRRGQFQQAREAYQKALTLEPGYPLAHLNLGILCDLYLQNRGCALSHYRAYQRLSAVADPQVELWIEDLQRQEYDQSSTEALQ